jgi:hypothetical protein
MNEKAPPGSGTFQTRNPTVADRQDATVAERAAALYAGVFPAARAEGESVVGVPGIRAHAFEPGRRWYAALARVEREADATEIPALHFTAPDGRIWVALPLANWALHRGAVAER